MGKSMDSTATDLFLASFHEHKHGLFRYAFRMLADREEAADIAQESFVRLYSTLQTGEQIENTGGFLFTIARNLCLNALRDRGKPVAADPADCPVVAISAETQHVVEAVLQRLEPQHREVLILREYHGFRYDEIARILQSTVPTVRTLLYRARLQLRSEYVHMRKLRI
jgi:RNA polymerase sigma-70 factor (ECF subfamily)